jgi:aminoglycoside phosphotransferase (APT) family kinase protein
MALPADPPPADVLRWVEQTAGRGYRVVRVRRLTGGVETATHLLILRRPSDGGDGDGVELVLRRPRGWAIEANPNSTADLASLLAHVATHAPDLPAPEVVAHRPDAALLRRLPGRIDLAPRDPSSWLQQQADALRTIHAIPRLPGAEHSTRTHDLRDRRPPDWSAHPHLWQQALDVIAAGHPGPNGATTFVHGDFQHFNLLWSRGRLTGIVDWSSAKARPPSRDLGHCRLNLAILYGADVADDFLRRYGGPIDPWWDLWETLIFLPSWGDTITTQVGSRLGAPVDVDAIHRRVDEHLRRIVQSIRAG